MCRAWSVRSVAMLVPMLVGGCTQPAEQAESAPATPGVSTNASLPEVISNGDRVSIEKYVAPGKTTIFDFSSPYCPPCQKMAPRLGLLHAHRDDIVVVTVNINRPSHQGIDWRSPVAKQYRLSSIPHFVIYGPDGQRQAEGDAAYEIVQNLLETSS